MHVSLMSGTSSPLQSCDALPESDLARSFMPSRVSGVIVTGTSSFRQSAAHTSLASHTLFPQHGVIGLLRHFPLSSASCVHGLLSLQSIAALHCLHTPPQSVSFS